MMHFFPSDKKVTNQILVRKKYDKAFNCYEISRTKYAEERDIFQRGRDSGTILALIIV